MSVVSDALPISLTDVKKRFVGLPDITKAKAILNDDNQLDWYCEQNGWLIITQFSNDSYKCLMFASDINGTNAVAVCGSGGQDEDTNIDMIPVKAGYYVRYVAANGNKPIDGTYWSKSLATLNAAVFVPFCD